jgi:hypothetical protein
MGLGLGSALGKPSEVEVGFRAGWVKYAKIALSSAGGAAIILAVFSILDRQPAAGFGLLASWGPWPVLGLVGLAIFGKFMSRMSDTIQSSFTAIVSNSKQTADAQTKTADALGKLAEQGSRHGQEVERLTIFAVQEFPIIHERLDKQDAMLREIHTATVGKGKGHEEDAG